MRGRDVDTVFTSPLHRLMALKGRLHPSIYGLCAGRASQAAQESRQTAGEQHAGFRNITKKVFGTPK